VHHVRKQPCVLAITELHQAEHGERAQRRRVVVHQREQECARFGRAELGHGPGRGHADRIRFARSTGLHELGQALVQLRIAQGARGDHRAHPQLTVRFAGGKRQERRSGVAVLDMAQELDGDALLRVLAVAEGGQERTHRALPELLQGVAGASADRRVRARGFVGERERERAVQLHQQAAIDRARRVRERERQQVFFQRFERAAPQMNLNAQARRVLDQLLIGRRAQHFAQQLIGFLDLLAIEQELGELKMHGEEPIIFAERAAELGDRLLRVLAPPVHFAQAEVAVRIVRAELDGAARVFDGALVFV
jgi:hypothetical protein